MSETAARRAGGGPGGGDPGGGMAEETLFYHEAALNATWAGSRLAIGALSFLFGSFVFAYFYLRSLNSHGMWRPAGFIPPHLWSGTVIVALVVVSAVAQTIALRILKGGNMAAWRRGAAAALAAGLAAVGMQVWDLLSLPFYPGNGGFASVFVGFYPVYAIVALAVMIWLETLIVRAARLPEGWFTEPPAAMDDVIVLQRFQAALSAFTAVWNYLAAIAVLAWVLFYLV